MRFQRAVEGPEAVALWRCVREAYETEDISVAKLAERFGVTRAAIMHRAQRDLWARRNRSISRVDHPSVLKRLFRVLELQVLHLELEMDTMHKADKRSGEREIELLGKLAANLEKLNKLETATARPESDQSYTDQEVAQMRTKLAKRLDQLKRS